VRPAYLIAGLLIGAAGLIVLTQLHAHSTVAVVLTGATMMAAGIGAALTLTADMILATAPPERAGGASALSETASELGGALGVAILGSVGAAVCRHEIAGALPGGLPDDARAAATDTLGGAAAVAGHLSGQAGASLLDAARVAFTYGLNIAAGAGAATMATAVVLAVVLLRRVELDTTPTEELTPEHELAGRHWLHGPTAHPDGSSLPQSLANHQG
jgi:DHA2 family multidrug resistance protein-like MFS transporter